MKELKITKGIVTCDVNAGCKDIYVKRTQRKNDYIAFTAGRDEEEDYANAEIIVQAFNVANQCGLTPKELLEQRDSWKKATETATEMAVTLNQKNDNLIEALKEVKRVGDFSADGSIGQIINAALRDYK